MESKRQIFFEIFWKLLCVLGVVCFVTGLFFYNYIEIKQLQGFHYYYYTNPYMEYSFPMLLVGLSSWITSAIFYIEIKKTNQTGINQPSPLLNPEN